MSSDPTYDVAVLGGGPAGVTAALQAARAGARTLLIEKNAQLGGTTVVAAINAIQSFFAYGQQVIAGIGWELAARSFEVLGEPVPDGSGFAERNGVTNVVVDRAVYAAVIDEAVMSAGIDLRLHTMLGDIAPGSGGDGWRLTLCGKEGLYDVDAKVVVDASGDANAITRAGLGVIRFESQQPGTLVLRFTGYDADMLDWDALQTAFDAAVEAGELKRSDTGWEKGNIRFLLGSYGGNRVHVVAENTGDSAGRTAMDLEARRIMLRLLKWCRRQPGLAGFTIAWFAPECGVRDTVVIDGRAAITLDDWVSGRVWEDAVSYSFYPVDVHTDEGLDYRPLARGVVPTIPFGAMLPKRGTNIIAAGRCICGDRLAFSGYRVQASCMGMGQAAGAAAAVAVERGVAVADVPIEAIRDTLRGHGAIVPPDLDPPA